MGDGVGVGEMVGVGDSVGVGVVSNVTVAMTDTESFPSSISSGDVRSQPAAAVSISRPKDIEVTVYTK